MSLRPLSPALYFWRNKTRALPVLGIIALSVLGVLTVALLADSMLDNGRRNFVGPTAAYSRLYARKNSLDPNIAAHLRHHPDVDRVLPALTASVRVFTLMGGDGNPVLGLASGDMDYFLATAGLQLVEGRLPTGSRREVALHDTTLRNKGLQIGDVVGKDLDRMEYLPAKFTVVGRLIGPYDLGVVPQSALREIYGIRGDSNLLVFPRPGRAAALDDYLTGLDSDEVGAVTPTTANQIFHDETYHVSAMLWAINGVTIVVLSLAVGLLNNIYFMQRLGEFGILAAIGYPVRYLIQRTLMEAMVLSLTGWLLGLGLSMAAVALMREWVFAPQGIALLNLSWRTIVFTLPIPVLTGLFSLATVVRRLGRLDPVSIVERRD